GLPLEHLVLEVTESVLVTRGGRLDPLRERGLGVAIDDFGTGYSSLQYLRQLAADALKIDRSFVRGLPDDQRDRILIESMIDMGRKFDLAVVVEGIESDAQRRLLADLGASIGQGYHFARPMTGEAVAREFLSRS
ncbi:MAG: EAL domain-containing protein, partial [Bradymonadaceae bacterium]